MNQKPLKARASRKIDVSEMQAWKALNEAHAKASIFYVRTMQQEDILSRAERRLRAKGHVISITKYPDYVCAKVYIIRKQSTPIDTQHRSMGMFMARLENDALIQAYYEAYQELDWL